MKTKKILLFAAALIVAFLAAFIVMMVVEDTPMGKSNQDGSLWIGSSKFAKEGKIMLYGEQHAVEQLLDAELALWQDYYHNEGMRHLFIEAPYYSAQLLNRWMQADDNEILDYIFENLEGTYGGSDVCYEFKLKIKETCPETIFHGTDVGHQYKTIGKYYLELLESEGKQDTEEYRLTEEAIEQGRKFYADDDSVYRENCMTANFMREYDALGGNISIMGIYGANHTPLTTFINIPKMGKDLYAVYGDLMSSVDLTEADLQTIVPKN